MPRWEVHLTAGLGASVILSFGMLMGAYDGGGLSGVRTSFGSLLPYLSLGMIALIAGSVLPDLDGRGKVKWLIGPLAGVMAVLPPVAVRASEGSVAGGIEFLTGPGSKLFLFSFAAGYMLLVIPFRHRGMLHSHRAALVFGTLWGAYLFLQPFPDPAGPFLAGTMGYLGYSWHLALDGRFTIPVLDGLSR